MFGTFFKSSLKTLPVLILFPILAFLIFSFFIYDGFAPKNIFQVSNASWNKKLNFEGEDGVDFYNDDYGEDYYEDPDPDSEYYDEGNNEGLSWMIRIMVIAIITNFVFLMIFPALFGGIKAATKQKQFYFGFFINLILMLLIPILLYYKYGFNGPLLIAEIGLHALSFLVPFILGAKFVAPAYVRAFWFAY